MQMFDFQDFFEQEYQFSLKEIVYNRIDSDSHEDGSLKITDNLSTAVLNECLSIVFERRVSFDPVSNFNTKVAFETRVKFKENKAAKKTAAEWKKILLENENIYLANMIPRASHLLASITASIGQPPLITQPGLEFKDN